MTANKSVALALMLISLTASCLVVTIRPANASEDSWTQKAPMHVARGRLGVVEVNEKIFAIGGDNGSRFDYTADLYNKGVIHTGTGNVVSTNEAYDPATDSWVTKASLPTPRYHFGITVCQNRIYCIGGYGTGVNEVYDPATDTWETKASMPTARERPCANAVDGKVYVTGGETAGFNVSNVNEVYDPSTDSWITKTPSPYKITSCGSAVFDDRIYFLATVSSDSNPNSGAFIEIYNPEIDSWSLGATAPTYGEYATAGVTTGVNAPERIYFLDATATNVYNPENDSWAVGSPMITSRGCVGVAVINDTFYAVGGVGGEIFVALSNNSLFGGISPSAVNEQYMPIGYEATVSPSPSLSPTLSPSPTPSPSPSPSPTASQQPTQTPAPQSSAFPAELIYAAAGTATIVVIVAVAVMLRRRK